MKKINPRKIRKAEIVIGIPSYNEADNIANVVRQIDKGLQKYFKGKSAVIVNSDNNSPDNTKDVFLNTETVFPKIYISTPAGVKGKGNNLRNLFLEIKSLDAKAAATVDADLKSITPEWIKCLINPILKGYDYLTPVYHRNKYGASITNRLCYPLIYGLLGYDMSQPIGGDMAFSKRTVNYWLDQKWSSEIKGYGIDIFMTLNAIKSGAKLGQANLGSKIHKPSTPKLDNMFLEVSATFFEFLSKNKDFWSGKIKISRPVLVSKIKSEARYPRASFNYKKLERKVFSEFNMHYKPLKPHISKETCFLLEAVFFKDKSLKIDNELWAKIVYQLFSIYLNNPKKEAVIKLLRALYFGRTISFIKEVSNKTQKEAEKIIQDEARYFYKTRDYLFSLI
jgi:glycosyltransferase involved in cell wall biosynthesis